jgi:hypothetical protein
MTTDASARQHLIPVIRRNCARFTEQAGLTNARLSGEQEQCRALGLSMKRELRKLAFAADKRGATGILDCGRRCAGEQSIPGVKRLSARVNARDEATGGCLEGGPLPRR